MLVYDRFGLEVDPTWYLIKQATWTCLCINSRQILAIHLIKYKLHIEKYLSYLPKLSGSLYPSKYDLNNNTFINNEIEDA